MSEQMTSNHAVGAGPASVMELRDIDPASPFFSQLDEAGSGPITVINVMVAPEEGVDELLRSWQSEATNMKTLDGFISSQLYRGVGDSRVVTNIAVWESAEALKRAFMQQSMNRSLIHPPPGSIAYPTLMRKAAVPGICVE